MARPWYETPAGQARLALEDKAMRRFHKGFEARLARDGKLYYRGELTTSLGPATYVVEVVFDDRHPDQAPAAYVRSPDLGPSVPHRYGDGRLCLFRPSDGQSGGFAPDRTTAATMVGWAAAWLHAYEVWKRLGRWPGPDGHGDVRDGR